MKPSSVLAVSLTLGALWALGCTPNHVTQVPASQPDKSAMPAGNETVLQADMRALSKDKDASAPSLETATIIRRGTAGGLLSGQKTAGPQTGYYQMAPFHTEEYGHITENIFHAAANEPLSTLSIDVDGAAYANVRRFLMGNQLPPVDAVRVEEFINYFTYRYPEPTGPHPFSITTEVASHPWAPGRKLVMIGLKGKEIDVQKAPASNLVFLIDTSGSMASPDKLPLLKDSFRLLVNQLRAKDRISIVTYAGSAGLVLPPTTGDKKDKILAALENLHAGGSTAGGQGIELAYATAKEHLIKNGNNRVILASDGDFNVGVSSDGELIRLIEEKRKAGIFLTVLGYGTGNVKDSKMEQLANKGNGNYAYIDSILEAKKVLVSQMGGTLHTIAKDVKLQVEFNPQQVKAYRLIGYENRVLKNEEFNDDTKDAGELGAGHTVTALYDVIPAGSKEKVPGVDELKYQKTVPTNGASNELLTVKFRYKKPASDASILLSQVLTDETREVQEASENLRFASAVAGFGMLLRNSEHKGNATFDKVFTLAKGALGEDKEGYRVEFLSLVRKAEGIKQTLTSQRSGKLVHPHP